MNVKSWNELFAQIQDCDLCECYQDFGYFKFPHGSYGKKRSKVWIIGADPRNIVSESAPGFWKGASGLNLRRPIEVSFKMDLEFLFYLTDVVKCQRNGKNIASEARNRCPKWMDKEIQILKPKAAIVLGTDAKELLLRNMFDRHFEEIAFLPYPSPANGKAIRKLFGELKWDGYRKKLLEACQHFLKKWPPL